ncbi:hypothetical protein [Geomesophilobacter sediminis]|uniref:Tetratricopeptide repeat protein n=1 Tax=Geomesophilobacter sediminis TaxID=2798584 RepID=A0A8J7M2M1_9BACT|nr:hypothetical protein [Geomesophilobacter sediminis]MBJ6727609.1 hypothetical protein [Geomesophilobacter sediminis]
MVGIVYYEAPADAVLTARDGKVELNYGSLPIPLLQADHDALEGELPSYDAVGRGLYHALRCDPDCHHAAAYARLIKEGYPHYLSELAGHIIMLGEKEVDPPYLERRINYLKIFALMEPENAQFPLETGASFLEIGVTFSALENCTVTLFKAERYLRKGLELDPGNLKGISDLAEVSFLLGKYEAAAQLWQKLVPEVAPKAAADLHARLEKIAARELPKVPAVDYLQAIAGAVSLKDAGSYHEAVAILTDVMADAHFCMEFPLPQIPYLLALCCLDLGSKGEARDFLNQALRINPEFAEAQQALDNL